MTPKMFEPIAEQRASESIFPLRDNEPEYAKLEDTGAREKNRYGQKIALYELVEEAASLNINGVDERGFNPNRNKQHAFHFTADNCIGCHACEAACSEKNDLPAHLSFRSVGYVEGGTYPNYTRMNISMACNHCDDPVCLKGCPTRAYTKHPEYGAVIQDPDICFGCGYCTWVCPYNAPQLDPVKGRVEKCNMCVDRLEVGLKPACVSACLANALDFGVVENTPENREQIETRIPGFPDPRITRPNIRFQQTLSMPREVTRPDSMPVKYLRDDAVGHYKPVIDPRPAKLRRWNLGRLSSRENPLVAFTLLMQAGTGLFALLTLAALVQVGALNQLVNTWAYPLGLLFSTALAGGGLLLSATHLGKPFRAYRGFNNLRHSPMAREGFAAMLFVVFAGLSSLASLLSRPELVEVLPLALQETAPGVLMGSAGLALLAAAGALYYMVRCYLIKARPFWDHWQTASSFIGASLYLGAVCAGLLTLVAGWIQAVPVAPVLTTLAVVALAGLILEGLGLYCHARDLGNADSEGAVSHYIQRTTFGKVYIIRNTLLGLAILAAPGLLLAAASGFPVAVLWLCLSAMVLVQCILGRALFYVLVVPTTMPGAFFWKNKGFEQHARDIGLAELPQVGVAKEH